MNWVVGDTKKNFQTNVCASVDAFNLVKGGICHDSALLLVNKSIAIHQ